MPLMYGGKIKKGGRIEIGGKIEKGGNFKLFYLIWIPSPDHNASSLHETKEEVF